MAKWDLRSGSPNQGRKPKKQPKKAAPATDRGVAEQGSGGEMGTLIRSKDWSKTRLGPMDAWPQSLKTTVGLILNSRHPMFVWWGEQLTNIYNDSYAPILGERHPAALGQPAPEIWHEIWDAVGPLAETVLQKGKSTWNEKLPLDLERHGYPEETFFTFSYSPVLDDDGKIGGLFCACMEETQQVVGERRLRALRQLSNLTADASTPVEACELIAGVIEDHPRDIAFGLVYLFEDSGKRARLVGHSRLKPGSAIAPNAIEAPGKGGPESFWPMEPAFRGEKAVVNDLEPNKPGGAWPEPVANAMVLPFGKSRQGRPLGILVLGASPRRPFDGDYQAYFELVADGAEAAVSNASLKAAEEGKDRFAFLAESSTDFIGICDKNFLPTYVNQAGLALVGLESLEEAQRTPVAEFFFPEDRAMIMDQFLPQVQRDGHGEVEVRFQHFKTGESIWVSYNVVVLKDPFGNLTGLATISRNITQRRQAEQSLRESERRFRALTTNAPTAIFVKDLEGRYTLANRLACTALGRPDAVGFTDHEMLPAEQADLLRSHDLQVISTGEPLEVEEVVGDRCFLAVKFPLAGEDGKPDGVCGVKMDITDRKRAERSLREADRRKDEFLAMLGHELRNPLAAISGGMSLLEANPTEERREWIERMMGRQIQQLGRLVNDLLDVTRITQGKIQLRKQRVEIDERFQAAVEAVRELVEERKHALAVESPEEPAYVMADPGRLDQILANLLTNAAKYTPNGGKIRLSAAIEGGEVVIRCRDNGIGLSAAALDSVFEPFVQLNTSLDRTGSGLGMGLNLVRMLARMHGGSVAAESEGAGKGSEFTVRLPLAAGPDDETSTVEAKPAATPKDNRAPLKILMVDDNRDLADSTAMFLRDAGHQLSVAYDGLSALNIAERERPQIVLLDLGMPGLNGYEIAARMRETPELAHFRLIAISGYPPKTKEGEAPLFDAHLVKPIDYNHLQQILQELTWSEPEKRSRTDGSKRILIVEDNQELALLTAELLGQRGQEVHVAFTGEEAIEEASRFRPQIVFCDLHLPGQSGFDVARRLREDESLQPLVLVGITADHAHTYDSEIESSPFDKFLAKPLAWPKVREILSSSEGLAQSGRSK